MVVTVTDGGALNGVSKVTLYRPPLILEMLYPGEGSALKTQPVLPGYDVPVQRCLPEMIRNAPSEDSTNRLPDEDVPPEPPTVMAFETVTEPTEIDGADRLTAEMGFAKERPEAVATTASAPVPSTSLPAAWAR